MNEQIKQIPHSTFAICTLAKHGLNTHKILLHLRHFNVRCPCFLIFSNLYYTFHVISPLNHGEIKIISPDLFF